MTAGVIPVSLLEQNSGTATPPPLAVECLTASRKKSVSHMVVLKLRFQTSKPRHSRREG